MKGNTKKRLSYVTIFLCALVFISFILYLPIILSRYCYLGLDFSNTGQIGDTLGGTMGPFIGIAATLLTFLAFWVQFKANEQQKNDLKIERFENKFYNMIGIHRQNSSEMKIGKSLEGRTVFTSMVSELRFSFLITKRFSKNTYQAQLIETVTGTSKIPDEILFNISYLIFFFGIGQTSTRTILDLVDARYHPFIVNLEEHFEGYVAFWKAKKKILRIEYSEKHIGDTCLEFKFSYQPFNGHMSRLSHYVRNLFQLVQFIDDQPDELFSYEDKYNYASTLRSQLSIFEQILLYYNSISVLGKPWMEKKPIKLGQTFRLKNLICPANNRMQIFENLIEKYCLIKSIPLPLADFYVSPKSIFSNEKNAHGKPLFEWVPIKERLNELSK